MSDIAEATRESIASADDQTPLNSAVAVLVAITATLTAIGNIKDGNIVQAMTRAQAKSVSAWSHYQSKSVKQQFKENALERVRLRLESENGLSDGARQRLQEIALRYEAEVDRYELEKRQIKQQAQEYENEYERLNRHDDQFDMAEACFTVAIALYGVTALTRKRWLLGIAISFSGIGAMLGAAGFLAWELQLPWLAALLG